MNNPSASLSHRSPFRTVALAGVAAGVLDAMAGIVVYYIYFDLNPIEVLQFIASGVFGPEAIGGGLAMVVAGTIFHFLIAFVAAFVYFIAYPALAILRRSPAVSGLAFGFGVWAVMNLLILPASNIPKAPFDAGLAVIGIAWHMVLVGLPIALITSAFFAGRPGDASVRLPAA